jgi:hypothetical protein
VVEERDPLAPWLPRGDIVTGAFKDSALTVRVNVAHLSAEAARAIVDGARVTHVEPVRTTMRYFLAITVVELLALFGMPILCHRLGLDWKVTVSATLVIGVIAAPMAMSASKLLEKIIGKV